MLPHSTDVPTEDVEHIRDWKHENGQKPQKTHTPVNPEIVKYYTVMLEITKPYISLGGYLRARANSGKEPAKILRMNMFAANALAASVRYVSTR